MLISKFNVVSTGLFPNNTSFSSSFLRHLEHLHTSQSSSIPKVTIDPSNRKMQTTYSNLMLGHGSPKSLISHWPLQNFIDVLAFSKKQCTPCSRNSLGQCKLIFIDYIHYLWLDGTRMQQKPQMSQTKIDQWLPHIATSPSFLHQQH